MSERQPLSLRDRDRARPGSYGDRDRNADPIKPGHIAEARDTQLGSERPYSSKGFLRRDAAVATTGMYFCEWLPEAIQHA